MLLLPSHWQNSTNNMVSYYYCSLKNLTSRIHQQNGFTPEKKIGNCLRNLSDRKECLYEQIHSFPGYLEEYKIWNMNQALEKFEFLNSECVMKDVTGINNIRKGNDNRRERKNERLRDDEEIWKWRRLITIAGALLAWCCYVVMKRSVGALWWISIYSAWIFRKYEPL